MQSDLISAMGSTAAFGRQHDLGRLISWERTLQRCGWGQRRAQEAT